MTPMFVGIDAGEDSAALCALDQSGAIVGEISCDAASNMVIEKLGELHATSETVIGIEAGGCGRPIARKLRAAGFQLRVLETKYVSRFLKVRQNKTDRNDTRGIAEIVRLGATAVPDVLIKPEAIQMLRSELVLRQRLLAQRVALENALHGTLRLSGGQLCRIFSGTHLERTLREKLDRLFAGGIDLREVIEPVAAILVELRMTIERGDRRLEHIAQDLEVCRRLMTIPGVGRICALSFYTAIADPYRFERNSDVGPYLGLVPRISQSGSLNIAGRITKTGNRMTRTHLVAAAGSMMVQAKKDSELRRWALRIKERSGHGKARVALARKLAVVMLAMWKSGEPFRLSSA